MISHPDRSRRGTLIGEKIAMCRWLVFVALAGCAHRSDVHPVPWRSEARTTHGVVRVMPVLSLHTEQEVELTSFVGPTVSWRQEWMRGRRVAELDRIPAALGAALPGAVNGALGSAWDGQFLRGTLAPTARTAVRAALKGHGDLDATLGAVGRGGDDAATLFTWVRSLEGRPLSAHAFPGEILHTEGGPVVLDLLEEPYLVEAEVGVALVARDGEVVLRLDAHVATVLSARRDAHAAARDLAAALADDVAKVWATDPRLDDAPAWVPEPAAGASLVRRGARASDLQ